MQDLGELIPELLKIKTKANVGMKFNVRLELGGGATPPSDDAVNDINGLLKDLGNEFRIV